MGDVCTTVRVNVTHLSTSIRSRSSIAQKASYWCIYLHSSHNLVSFFLASLDFHQAKVGISKKVVSRFYFHALASIKSKIADKSRCARKSSRYSKSNRDYFTRYMQRGRQDCSTDSFCVQRPVFTFLLAGSPSGLLRPLQGYGM